MSILAQNQELIKQLFIMKKLALFLFSIFVLSLVMSSCASNKKCAAYGESYQYQKDNRR